MLVMVLLKEGPASLSSYWAFKLRVSMAFCLSGIVGAILPGSFKIALLCIIMNTVISLNIGTDRSEQTVRTQIRLLLMEQSDQGLLCLLFCLHLLNTILHCKIQLF